MMKLSRVAVILALMGALTASAAESISGNITAVNANPSSGTATSGSTVALDLAGGSMYDPVLYQYNSMSIQVTGTFTATLTFQSSFDGSTWVSHTVTTAPVTASIGTQVTTATAAGKWYANVSGLRKFRVTCTSYTSGTAAVVLTTGSGAQLVAIQSMPPLAAGTAALGEVTAVGKAAENAAVTGYPVLSGGRYDTSPRTLDNGDVGAIAVDVAGRPISVGPAAENAAVVGSPLLAGGRYDSTPRTLDNGDVGAVALDVAGRPIVVGPAADDAAIAGNPVPVGIKAVAAGAQPSSATAGDVVYPIATVERIPYVINGHPNAIHCNVAVSTATTLTAVGGSCAAPGAGLSIYITGINFGSSVASSTAADAFPTIKSGTGGTCGSSTAVVWSAMTEANTTTTYTPTTPIRVAANSELCWIHSVAGSKVINITGFIAP